MISNLGETLRQANEDAKRKGLEEGIEKGIFEGLVCGIIIVRVLKVFTV